MAIAAELPALALEQLMMSVTQRPLFELFPRLEPDAGFARLGDFPTPIESLSALAPDLGPLAEGCFVKRDDLSSSVYGGNKVRTLEALFGQALRARQHWVASTGAYGSNHAVATVLHGKRLGFRSAALLFPQPGSETARANLRVSLARADRFVALPHWVCLPAGMWWFARELRRRGESALIMPPGGASPRGCLGFLSAALEVGLQVQQGVLPRPAEIVLALGSTCSTAGLLVGLAVAARLGLGFGERPPRLVAVRVTPWPVTSPLRILRLACRLVTWLRQLSPDPVFAIERSELARGLELEPGQLGRGYGYPTPAGRAAIARAGAFAAALDTTYSAKSAAALLERVQSGPACTRLFWSTKSSAPLPEVSSAELGGAPPRLRRWLAG